MRNKQHTKWLLSMLLFALLLISSYRINAQDIQMTIIAPPPHPSLLSDFQEASNNYRVNIVNLNPNESYEILIDGMLTGDNGIEVSLKDDYNGFQSLTIPAGSNEIYLFEELGNFLDGVTLDEINYSGVPDPAYLIQSQRIPDGVYRICLEARDFTTNELLSLPMNINCSNPILIQSINPPVITNPLAEENILQIEPTFFNINWTPVMAPGASIVYDLRIAEHNELVNIYDAIDNDNFLQYSEQDLLNTTFVYNQSHTPLVEGRKYIVRVRARDENNSVNIFNEGWSDAVVFHFGNTSILAEDQEEEPIVQQGEFDCMQPCSPVNIAVAAELPSIEIGQTFSIGHFNLEIADYQQTINGYSGTGVIKASDFLPQDIKVSFNDIQINERNQITNGLVSGLRKEAARAFPRVSEFGDQSGLTQAMIDRMYDEILAPGAEMISEDINESMAELGEALSLPIALGEGDYKIHIPDMTFSPQGASISMITGYEWLGDYQTYSKKLLFASPDICISPGGLSLTEEILQLSIVKPYDFNPSEVYGIHINGSNDTQPSYISIDCDGINKIVLNGHISFSNDYAKPINENGEIVENKIMASSFEATFSDWDEMIFSANISNRQGADGELYFSDKMELSALPEFQLNLEDFVLDMSESSMAENMTFPAATPATDDWIGAYFSNIEIEFPDYFEQGDQPIRLALNDMIIDENGASFQLIGANFQELSDLSFATWGINLSTLILSVNRNEITNGTMLGSIELPITDNPVGFRGSVQNINGQINYNLSLRTANELEVPMWFASFNLDRTSSIGSFRRNGTFGLEANLHGSIDLDDAIGDWDQVKIKNINFEDFKLMTAPPYFETGSFDIDGSFDAEFLGFNIDIEDINLNAIPDPNTNYNKPELSLDLGFKFGQKGGGSMYLGADSKLKFRGRFNPQLGRFVSDNFMIETIHLDSEVPMVKVQGELSAFNNDPTYGDGFDGDLSAEFVDMFTIDASAIFGSKRNYDYWYVNAGSRFQQGVPLLAPIEIKGFSGGAYMNMDQRIDWSQAVGGDIVTYVPARGDWGMQAGLTWATSGVESMLNGNVDFTVDMNNRGRIDKITLEGEAQMMNSLDYRKSAMSDANIWLKGVISYNQVQESLKAKFGYNLAVPRDLRVLAGGNIDTPLFDFEVNGLNDWHFLMGRPSVNGSFGDMMDINIGIDYKIRGKNKRIQKGIHSYFNIGSDIPAMPPLPAEARDLFPSNYGSYDAPADGVAAGLHMAFRIPRIGFDLGVIGLKFSANAGVGCDVHLAKLNGALCNGSPNFGIDNWYFRGRGYVYANASIRGKLFWKSFNMGSVSAGALLHFEGPNPLYASGQMGIRIKPPIISNFTLGLGISLGTKCQFSEDDNAQEEFLDELANISILEELQGIPETVDFWDKTLSIDAQYAYKPRIVHREDFFGDDIRYKIDYDIILNEMQDGEWVRVHDKVNIHHLNFHGGRTHIKFNQDKSTGQQLLRPGKQYQLRVFGALLIEDEGTFQLARRNDNSIVRATKVVEFSTNDLSEYEVEIIDANPALNTRHIFIDNNKDASYFELSDESVERLDQLANHIDYEIKLDFNEYYAGTAFPTPRTISSITQRNGNRWTFGLNVLRPNYDYFVEINLIIPNNDPIRIGTMRYFTSKYRTLFRKMNALEVSIESYQQDDFLIKYRGDESFTEIHERVRPKYQLHEVQQYAESPYHRKRVELEDFAERYGFLNTVRNSCPEFILRNNQQNNQNQHPLLVGIDFDFLLNDPVQLSYVWRPNKYLKALRDYAIENHGVVIQLLGLQDTFYGKLPGINSGYASIKLKAVHERTSSTNRLNVQ